jgi:shikimate kinase
MLELQGINIYLIGMMGVGKSSVGRILAQKIGYSFFDTDPAIEQLARMKIDEIFQKEGEEKFRDIETEVLAEIAAYQRIAIATGGGIVERIQNWGYLQYGLVVWLDASEELILKRIQTDPNSDNRPLRHQIHSRLERRLPLYAQADLKIAIKESLTPETIAEQIVADIPSILKQKFVLSN